MSDRKEDFRQAFLIAGREYVAYKEFKDRVMRDTLLELSEDNYVKLVFDDARNWLTCAALFGGGLFLLRLSTPHPLPSTIGGVLLVMWAMLLWITNLSHGVRKASESLNRSESSHVIRNVELLAFLSIYVLASALLIIVAVEKMR